MDALIVSLSSKHVGCYVDGVCVNNLSYADDIAPLSASVCGLERLLRVCEEYALSHGLKYNVAKSQFMAFEAGCNRPSNVSPVILNGSPLERVDLFKYLGHIDTTDLRHNADIERKRERCRYICQGKYDSSQVRAMFQGREDNAVQSVLHVALHV
ncbi:uncharacterized protein [Choristoneura fumiferana]|uniref:uncharacterized protein n=1 Tax=Choristoneura fumiferana TaxID=7141 RepID=UPI003D155E80